MTGIQNEEGSPPPQQARASFSGDIVSVIGEALREPLHALWGLLELLSASPLPEERFEMIEAARVRLEHLRSLVDDVIDASRLQLGKLPFALRSMSLGSLVADVVANGTVRAGSDAVRIVADVGPGVPSAVLVDPLRLRQLLDKLVDNAIASTPAGRITVGLTTNDEGSVVFRVADSGAGLPAADLAAVFEPFHRNRDGRAAGTGLDLTLVELLAIEMGGSAAVSSVEGVGTTFIVSLPLKATDLPPEDLDDRPSLAGGGLPVMVVDAEPVNRMLAVGQLSHLGMRGVAVASGEEAVALLAEGMGPDIVLMDLVLRGIDGLEATRRIRAQEDVHGRRAVIVGLTASSLATDRLVADEAGMDEVLTKPMGLTTLSQAMSRWVAGDGRLPAEPPAVDRDVLASLVEDLGTESVVIDLVHLYLNELPSRRYVLANAADRADLAAAKSMADTLQSTSLLLGATGVAHACQRLSDAEQPVDVDHLVADIVRATTSAHRSLQQWLSERPAPPR